jgi:hypothetical protein
MYIVHGKIGNPEINRLGVKHGLGYIQGFFPPFTVPSGEKRGAQGPWPSFIGSL